jgi:hypothetical protein
MHILLINANPVISRLLALCTRNVDMVLEELEDITVAQRKSYDIVFIDEVSYKDEVLQFNEYVNADKKVIFSNEDIIIDTFDITIKKPFLPSQIIELLDNVETKSEQKDISIFSTVSEEVGNTEPQVLDSIEVEKIKALLNMEDELDITEELSEDEIEVRKIEVIKEQLIADGLEIIDEDKIVEELSAKDTIKIFEDDVLPQVENITIIKSEKKEKRKKKKNKSKKKDKKILDYTEQELEKIEDAIQMAMVTLERKQMKKLMKGKKIKVEVQIKGEHS